MAVPPEEAERRCRRALMEAWVGRETAAFRLPPSRLALDPADVIRLAHDGRLVDLRLVSIADAEARGIEAVRQDRAAYDLPPGDPRPASLTRAVVFGAPDVGADGPAAADRGPARASAAGRGACRSLAGRDGGVPQPLDGWLRAADHVRQPRPDRHAGRRTSIAGPTSRFDLGNALVVDLLTGTLESVTDLTLFGGANALAVESRAGRLGDRAGGRGRTDRARPLSPDPAPARPARHRGRDGQPGAGGARVVVLDAALAVAADRRGRSRSAVELAHRPGEPSGQRRDLCRRRPSRPRARAAAVLGRPCRAAVAHAAHARRSDDPLDAPVPRARRPTAWGAVEVPLAEELEAYEVEILDGATVKRMLTSDHHQRRSTPPPSRPPTGARRSAPATRSTIRIFQLSALVGRGAPKTVTLTF